MTSNYNKCSVKILVLMKLFKVYVAFCSISVVVVFFKKEEEVNPIPPPPPLSTRLIRQRTIYGYVFFFRLTSSNKWKTL